LPRELGSLEWRIDALGCSVKIGISGVVWTAKALENRRANAIAGEQGTTLKFLNGRSPAIWGFTCQATPFARASQSREREKCVKHLDDAGREF
jgi:hypothetical protein